MQLNEILEENTVKAISEKTKISEANIDALVTAAFDKIKKAKTMGFISIIEREYGADLSTMRAEALAYYEGLDEDQSITLGMPIVEEKKGTSKLFKLIVLILIGYALWYAFINFDKEKLESMFPFSEKKLSQMITPDKDKSVDELSIEYVQSKEDDNSTDTK